jgi:hypothetical protein
VRFTQDTIAAGAQICPMLPMQCLQAQSRIPNWATPWTQVIRDETGRRRWHVSGWGKASKLPSPVAGGRWSCRLTYLPGEPNELVIAAVEAPRSVKLADELLSKLAPDADAGQPGWRYDPDLRAVLIRFIQPEEHTEIAVLW